jgi:Fungal specific transcription factor domain
MLGSAYWVGLCHPPKDDDCQISGASWPHWHPQGVLLERWDDRLSMIAQLSTMAATVSRSPQKGGSIDSTTQRMAKLLESEIAAFEASWKQGWHTKSPSTSPDSRTELDEEIAGITAYSLILRNLVNSHKVTTNEDTRTLAQVDTIFIIAERLQSTVYYPTLGLPLFAAGISIVCDEGREDTIRNHLRRLSSHKIHVSKNLLIGCAFEKCLLISE